MPLRIALALAIEALVFAGLLFGGAGTLQWPQAWIFLSIFFTAATILTRMLALRDPALLEERMKPLFQSGQPLWDKILLGTYFVVFLAWLPLMGVDKRFAWSAMPMWVEIVGGALLVVSWWIAYIAFRENPYLINVVKIQHERGQHVIATGPYAVVRHPLYAGALLMFAAIALLLGSVAGLTWAALLGAMLVVRTALEDRELQRGLDGYRDYARRVRYRLVPGIW